MKKFTKVIVVFLIVGLFMTSCKKLEIKEEAFNEADTVKFDKKDRYYEPYDTGTKAQAFDFKLHLFKGSTWRMWRKIHKECMQAQWIPNSYYFGVSNTIGLGAIINKDDGLERRLEDALTTTEVPTVLNYGNWTTCNYSQELTINLNTFLQADFAFTDRTSPDLNTELAVAIVKASSTQVKIDSWRVNNLVEGPLKDLIKGSSDPKKQAYLNDLTSDNNRIVMKEIEVKGFTSLVQLSTDMSANLEAKLKQGVIAKIGNSGFEAEFKFINRREIEVKSGGNFRPFGVKMKGEKV